MMIPLFAKGNKELVFNEVFNLTPSEMVELPKKALEGDWESCNRVLNYYTFYDVNLEKMIIWAEYLFENNQIGIAHNLAYYLEIRKKKKDLIRSAYLYFLAKSIDSDFIKDISLESPYPLLNEDVYEKTNDKISDYEIEVLSDYALRGGKKEAYKLYEYYRDYKQNETEAVYWLRVGAQNKNSDCQYEYGKYLLSKDDENEKIRGIFWIKKAAFNDNKEAWQFLKQENIAWFKDSKKQCVKFTNKSKTKRNKKMTNLTSEEIIDLTKKALAGDWKASYRILNYYSDYEAKNFKKIGVWLELIFENEALGINYELANNLSYMKNNKKALIRSTYLYFLTGTFAVDDPCIKKIIKKKRLSLESPYPLLNEDVYEKTNDKISDYEIEVLSDYALRGGKKEAYKLYEYYRDYKQDEQEAVYWLRTGAQNKSDKCQFEYGKYLLASEDEYKKIRGKFWIKKAANNGNTEAKKLLKELERNEE